jgi:hypothetical protein
MLRGRLAPTSTRLALLLALGACTEQATAPGMCPAFCPGGKIQSGDTIFTNMIERDSAFTGYVETSQGPALRVADLAGAGVDSRAIFRMVTLFTRVTNRPTDTATVPITMDSARLRLNIIHRDTNTANLWIKLYRLPIDLDSTTTFTQLVPSFTDSIVDSVSLAALLAAPEVYDTATLRVWGDTIQADGAGHVLQVASDSTLLLFFHLDTAQARFAVPDSAAVAYGVRVSADSLASIALGSNESPDRGARITWFYTYPDSTAAPVQASRERGALFDSFVFIPPTPPPDSNLAVGGAPAARSLLRVRIPPLLRDSADVVRATLILVPVGPVPGAAGDSFVVLARPVLTDIGAKSPLSTSASFFGSTTVHVNAPADTVRIELTNLIRAWSLDTTAATAFVLSQLPEAASYTQVRFYSTRAPAFRPALRVTYVRRYPFGTP